MQVTTEDIKRKTGFAWDPQPQRHSVQRMFFKFNPLFLVLTSQIIHQYPRSEPIWSLLNMTHDTSFHNSIEWSEIYLQANIPPWLGKILRFTVFRLLQNVFVILPSSSGMIWSLVPACRTTSHKFSKKSLSPHGKHFLEKIIHPYFEGVTLWR